MNIIFTICAKNYLASALTLKESVKSTNPNSKFFIVLADDTDGLEQEFLESNSIIPGRMLNIPGYDEMAFRYDVVEFNTSIKPYAFRYFFNMESISMVMYLDPDIYVYDRLDDIWDTLKEYSVVLTPHAVDSNERLGADYFDETFLRFGIYNLGFVAINSKYEGPLIVEWWCNRLRNKCLMDTPYFVDQKWMDFVPAIFDKVFIDRSKRYNLAWWNFKERKLCSGDDLRVKNAFDSEKVSFIHFSNFKPGMKVNYILERGAEINSDQMNILQDVYMSYEKKLLKNNYVKYSQMKYSYDYYSDGHKIEKIHRKLYSTFLKESNDCSSPFDSENGLFPKVLKENNLMSNNNEISIKSNTKKAQNGLSKKAFVFELFCKLYVKFFGVDKYQLLISKLQYKLDINRQDFLIRR